MAVSSVTCPSAQASCHTAAEAGKEHQPPTQLGSRERFIFTSAPASEPSSHFIDEATAVHGSVRSPSQDDSTDLPHHSGACVMSVGIS